MTCPVPNVLTRPSGDSVRAGLAEGSNDLELRRLVPRHLAERNSVLPLARQNHSLSLAMVDPTDILAIDEISQLTGCRVRPVAASREEIAHGIARFYAGEVGGEAPEAAPQEGTTEATDILDLDGHVRETAPAIRLLNHVMEQAIAQRASDIHIQPGDRGTVVRFRIDGVMYTWSTLRCDQHAPLISRIKVLARMNIAKRRLPLDGRFRVRLHHQQYDIRVSAPRPRHLWREGGATAPAQGRQGAGAGRAGDGGREPHEAGSSSLRSTGYQGRLAVFELMKLTEPLKQLIHRKESASTIRQEALSEGMVSLRQDAIRKVVAGLTTPEEVFRSVYLEG